MSKWDPFINFNIKEFSAEVRSFMARHNVSTRQFQDILKTPYTSFCRIERGEHGITMNTLQSILRNLVGYDEKHQKFLEKTQRRMASNKKS